MAISGDVLVDTFVADRNVAATGDLFRAEAFDPLRVHPLPRVLIDTRLRTCRVSALRALLMCLAGRLARVACSARPLAADRARIALHVLADLAGGKTAAMQVLNLVAFVLAQVRVAHVQFHLAVKLCRLPRLRLFTSSGDALQN